MDELKTFSETKFKLKLGDKEHTVNFGVHARRRIEEKKPGFTIFGSDMPDFEVVPFLIQCGIAPESRNWESEDQFIEFYESCEDVEGLGKVALAFQNALGFTNRQFGPVIERLSEVVAEATKEKEANQKSPKK
ncbi:hypothetical protein [Dyadobacter sp. CY323]|uniref:hypothetical protein n=1 Tax=Dyadobacter sp. CY323 TaxID=2907302 RepID=UPI001F3620FE|nr:hypothetical protein [Dyadobacter sp. CY323]MCE6992103.1 hypothetical protein [Dyadobacter sp. CY323]